MVDRKLSCTVVTPEKVVFDGEVNMIIAPGADGEVGILPLHVPYLTMLNIGELRLKITRDGKEQEEKIAVHGGFIEVYEDKVTVLAPAAELASEIDAKRADLAHERAEKRLQQAEDIDAARADAALRRARMRKKILEKK